MHKNYVYKQIFKIVLLSLVLLYVPPNQIWYTKQIILFHFNYELLHNTLSKSDRLYWPLVKITKGMTTALDAHTM